MRAWALAGIGAAVFAVDHWTKWLAVEYLLGQPPVDVIPNYFRLDYAENTGGAFSLLADKPLLLTALSCLSLLLVAWFLRHTEPERTAARLGLALLLGGAAANLADRFFRGYVVDFFDAYWGSYHWPTFNIADMAICVGAGLFVLFGVPEIEEELEEEAEARREEEKEKAAPAKKSGGKKSSNKRGQHQASKA